MLAQAVDVRVQASDDGPSEDGDAHQQYCGKRSRNEHSGPRCLAAGLHLDDVINEIHLQVAMCVTAMI